MKRFLILCTVALSLGGCAGTLPPLIESIFNLPKGVLTASVTNPVTPDMMYDVENTAVIAVSGLLAYKRACIAKSIDQSCRDVIPRLQVYTRKIRVALPDLRKFFRANDQLNASIAYNEIRSLLDGFKSTATDAGVK